MQEVQEEGKHAIDSPGCATALELPPEDYELEENEERSMIEPRCLEDPKLQELIYVLIEWINDELADQRIIVKDIAEDLYDGQVLQKLLGMFSISLFIVYLKQSITFYKHFFNRKIDWPQAGRARSDAVRGGTEAKASRCLVSGQSRSGPLPTLQVECRVCAFQEHRVHS